jgi:hypothetical protein
MKTRSFLLAAGIVLAMAFTFSCSSGDGGGSSSSGGINLTNLPLYYDGVLEGKIDVFLLARYDTLPAGKIENGRLSLSLPNIDSKYRFDWWYSLFRDDDDISIVPQDVALFPTDERCPFFAIIPGKGRCYIGGILKNEAMYAGRGVALLVYNSASGTVTGTRDERQKNEETNYNLNLSQGWQVLYGYSWNRDMYEDGEIVYVTTTLPANTTLEWTLTCSSVGCKGVVIDPEPAEPASPLPLSEP